LVKFGATDRLMMIDLNNIRIAVDFDGTIVEHEYPEIGKEKLFAFRTLQELQKRGARLILWTFRTGEELEDAVEYCRQYGIEFYAVNKNYPEEVMDESVSRKIDADIYIDDKNIGGFPGWSEVWQMIYPYDVQLKEAEKRIIASRKNIIKRLFTRIFKTDAS
jgi:hydroxymethylpyrimidine pyrophosphatase-like HAD family hydrolase